MTKTEQLKKLLAGAVHCPVCKGKGYIPIWPPYGGISGEPCDCAHEKHIELRNFLRNNADAMLEVLEAVEGLVEIDGTKSTYTVPAKLYEELQRALSKWRGE